MKIQMKESVNETRDGFWPLQHDNIMETEFGAAERSRLIKYRESKSIILPLMNIN